MSSSILAFFSVAHSQARCAEWMPICIDIERQYPIPPVDRNEERKALVNILLPFSGFMVGFFLSTATGCINHDPKDPELFCKFINLSMAAFPLAIALILFIGVKICSYLQSSR